MPYYLNPVSVGTSSFLSIGDGYSMNISWYQAIPTISTNRIAYHIYYSTVKENVFTEGVKYISIDNEIEVNLIDFIPGQEYFGAVRPVEYNPIVYNLSLLPVAYDNLRIYPSSVLRQDITATDLTIPLMDLTDFPSSGVIRVGAELIEYTAADYPNNNLLLSAISQRGYEGTLALPHDMSGYDGYSAWSAQISIFTFAESTEFDRIYTCQSRFEYPNYPMTVDDGYRQVIKDLLSTDLSASDEQNEGFPMYDYAGYHRTDPVQLLTGVCVGSYIGGAQGCIDEYGNMNVLRGMSLQDQNNQRQEMLLSVTGRPAVLLQRSTTGITCSCYLQSSEYFDDRCPNCNGTKFTSGYQQYFNPRRSDGRILIRVGPADENTKIYEAGLESELPVDLWTLTIPTIKTRDVIILFDVDDNEEFRYEIMNVTRNNTIVGMEGGQKMRAVRIRKTDPAYQIRSFKNTSLYPSNLNTGIGFTTNIPPHTHVIRVSEKVTSLANINQTTSVSQGHSHQVVDGVVMNALSHSHTIILL